MSIYLNSMDEAKAKKYAAILEIIILLSIAIYYINKIFLKNHIENVSSNFNDNRQNPSTIVTAGLYGKSSSDVMTGIMGQKTQSLFKRFLTFLNPILSIFAVIFNKFKQSINDLRKMLRPIRDFFNKTARMFYSVIQKFTIGILYSMHKMRNSMRRSMSGFNILMHSLEHSKNSMQAMVTSPPVKMAVKWLPRARWLGDKAGDLFCFDKDTYIKLLDGEYVKIMNIRLGDIIEDGSEVIAVQTFSNKYPVYKYDNIYVSGGHIVKENDNWVSVRNSKKGTPVYIKPPTLYCLSTTSGCIKIGDIIFKDYEGATNKYINKTINSLILMHLNMHEEDNINDEDIDINKYSYGPKYLENGFHPDTLLEMKGGYSKALKDVIIGDTLAFYNKVIGKVVISSKYINYYRDHNDVFVTTNTKVRHEGIWKNIETLPEIQPEDDITEVDAINLITDNSTIKIKSKRVTKTYRDYVEIVDKDIESEIENLVKNTP